MNSKIKQEQISLIHNLNNNGKSKYLFASKIMDAINSLTPTKTSTKEELYADFLVSDYDLKYEEATDFIEVVKHWASKYDERFPGLTLGAYDHLFKWPEVAKKRICRRDKDNSKIYQRYKVRKYIKGVKKYETHYLQVLDMIGIEFEAAFDETGKYRTLKEQETYRNKLMAQQNAKYKTTSVKIGMYYYTFDDLCDFIYRIAVKTAKQSTVNGIIKAVERLLVKLKQISK